MGIVNGFLVFPLFPEDTRKTHGCIEVKEIRKFEPTLDHGVGEDRVPNDKYQIVTALEVTDA